MFKIFLEKITAGQHLDRKEAGEALEMIISEQLSAAEIGGLLVGLKVKGESVPEILGFIDTMEKHMIKVELQDKNAVDVCGTGGDGRNSFNVSTTVAIIVAAGGVTVAKHGNRSVSSKCGSADVLEALGVRIDLSPEAVKQCINSVGIGFFFAPLFHPAMKAVAPHRRSLGIRTFFNMLGPLLNPARVRRQLIGAYDLATAQKLADVLNQREYLKACTVHSADGFDELSPFAVNHVFEVSAQNGGVKNYLFPAQIPQVTTVNPTLAGADSQTNAQITLKILQSERNPLREMTILNAAFAFYVADRVGSVNEGIQLAAEVIDSGGALKKLDDFRQYSNELHASAS